MAKIKPFSALKYSAGSDSIKSLVCPPYDIISDSERQELLNKNPHNLIRLELPRGENAYEDAARTLKTWLNEGVMKEDAQEGIYIYEEKFEAYGKKYSLKGFISLVFLHDFCENVVLPHEETLSKAKQDRFNLMQSTGVSFSQIYSLYMDEDRAVSSYIDKLSLKEPDISFKTEDNIEHNLWCVYDKEAISFLSDKMADKKLYIADGHHRYETALNFRNTYSKDRCDEGERLNYCMMMLVNMENDGLVVFPTHRIVHSLQNFDKEVVLEECKKHFEIESIDEDKITSALSDAEKNSKKAFVLCLGEADFKLLILKNEKVMSEILAEKSVAYRNLDVSVLHSLVLERLFKIDKENMANQKNLRYTRDISEAIDAVKSGEANCSFLINPTKVTEIRDVALANEKMPQKSTYFYPKIITGLVMNRFRK